MNKDFYIDSQIDNAFINNVLLKYDKETAYKILMNRFNEMELSDHIDTYLFFSCNNAFLLYFKEAREKLISILEINAFKLNNIDDEYLAEEALETQGEIIDIVNSLKCDYNNQIEEEIEKYLLFSRGVDSNIIENKKDFLTLCYMYDYTISLYLNGRIESLDIANYEYPFLLMSTYYYLSTICFSDNNNILERINGLLTYDYEGDENDLIVAATYREMISSLYEESLSLDYEEYIDGEMQLSEEELKEVKKNREKCKIKQIKDYLKDE